jgi:transketolase
MPNMTVWRPCDTVETVAAWADAIERKDGPTSLVLTRQGVPFQSRSADQLAAIRRGGYKLRDSAGEPELVLIATGSEVGLAVAAAEALESDGVAVRVVSMPSTNVFDAQDASWREAVLPPGVTARIAIEAGSPDSWYRYVGPTGCVIGIDTFGQSAPAGELFEHYGFSVANVVAVARDVMQDNP